MSRKTRTLQRHFSRANGWLKVAKLAQNKFVWRMAKGKFEGELRRVKLSGLLYDSAMREFHRVAPYPKGGSHASA